MKKFDKLNCVLVSNTKILIMMSFSLINNSPAMYIIARMMSARESITPGFRDVLGVDQAIYHRFKNNEYDDLYLSAAENGELDILTYLLENGINIDTRNEYGDSALHLAAENGHINTMKLLLDSGLNKDVTDNNGWTPLKLAVYTGQTYSVKCLLNAGARKDTNDTQSLLNWAFLARGVTLLHIASRHGYTDIVHLLIEAGFNVNARDIYGETPVIYAARNGHPDTAKALMNAGANSEIGWKIVKTAEMYRRREKWPRNYRHSTYDFSLNNRTTSSHSHFKVKKKKIHDGKILLRYYNTHCVGFNTIMYSPTYKQKQVKQSQRLYKKNKPPRRQKHNHR